MKSITVSKEMRELILSSGLVAAILAVYGQVGGHAFINFDDGLYAARNPKVAGGLTWEGFFYAFSNTDSGNWHPVTWLSHMLDAELYGLRAGGHLLSNVAWHTACAVLLYLLLRRWRMSMWASWFVAAIFAVHPGNVENVAWVSERKSLLSMAFSLGVLHLYCSNAQDPSLRKRIWSYILYVTALMSKSVAVSLPLLMLLLDYWPLQRFSFVIPGYLRRFLGLQREDSSSSEDYKTLLRLAWAKWPYGVIAAVFCLITLYAQATQNAVHSLEHNILPHRVTNVVFAYARYLKLFFAPDNHSLFYPLQWNYPLYTYYSCCVIVFSAVASALVLGLRWRYVFTGFFWFFLSLVPMIGVVPVGGQGWADRYLYLPIIGLSLLVVGSSERFLQAFVIHRGARATAKAALLGSCVILGALAWRQVLQWQDSFTIFQQTVENARSGRMVTNLALAAIREGMPHTARYWLGRLPVTDNKGQTAGNLSLMAITYLASNDWDIAISLEKKAVSIDPSRAQSWHNLGICYLKKGKHESAYEALTKAVRLDPQNDAPYNNLFIALRAVRLGRSQVGGPIAPTPIGSEPTESHGVNGAR